jgi:hypothetical protein
MKVYVLFDYADYVGVFATYQAAKRAIPEGRRPEDFKIHAEEVQT